MDVQNVFDGWHNGNEQTHIHKNILKLLSSNLWLFEFVFVWNMQKILYLWPKNKHCFNALTSIELFSLFHFHALSWLNKVFFSCFLSFHSSCFWCCCCCFYFLRMDIHNWTLYMCTFLYEKNNFFVFPSSCTFMYSCMLKNNIFFSPSGLLIQNVRVWFMYIYTCVST